MKLEDILKQQGYSDADLETIKPMLSDQRFRSSMEASLGNLVTERDSFKGRVDELESWREQTVIPKMDEWAAQATAARTEAARLREENKIAKEYGYLPKTQEQEDPAAVAARESAARAQQSQPGQPADNKNYLTRDDANQFAQSQAMAMAQFTNLAEEYRVLNPGKSLFEYQGQNGLVGLEALLQEQYVAKVPLKQYVANKFGFQAKRDEMSAAQRKVAEDAIRQDERAKVAAEFGNPMMRAPMASRHAIIPPKPADTGMPWDKTPNELKERRMQNAIKSLVQ